MKPSEFLETRELCKRVFFLRDGLPASENESDSCCTVGALFGVNHDEDSTFRESFIAELGRVIGDSNVTHWNDRPETTKEMVVAALRETEKRLGML